MKCEERFPAEKYARSQNTTQYKLETERKITQLVNISLYTNAVCKFLCNTLK